MIYLDYAASAPIYKQALDKLYNVTLDHFGNPGAIHSAGCAARKILQESRKAVASLLNVHDREVFFTSGATEANNWAIRSACSASAGKHIIVFAAEHSSVLEAAEAMKASGYTVTRILPDSGGCLPLTALESAITSDTCLVCVQAVNNETGVIQDIAAIADIVHKHGAAYLCDAVQSFGHVSLPLHRADYISITSHKLGGPRGVGCLVARYPHSPKAMIHGGGQELGLRSGTENIPAIAAFALAAQLSALMREEEYIRLRLLSDRFIDALREIDPEISLNASGSLRFPGIMSIRFPGILAEEMVSLLDLDGIYASPGAACAARDSSPSNVLLAMGYSQQHAKESVRFSIGRLTTPKEIDDTIAAIRRILRIRKGM